jgi:hypothetical protein
MDGWVNGWMSIEDSYNNVPLPISGWDVNLNHAAKMQSHQDYWHSYCTANVQVKRTAHLL